jgi:hypothetical protein
VTITGQLPSSAGSGIATSSGPLADQRIAPLADEWCARHLPQRERTDHDETRCRCERHKLAKETDTCTSDHGSDQGSARQQPENQRQGEKLRDT